MLLWLPPVAVTWFTIGLVVAVPFLLLILERLGDLRVLHIDPAEIVRR
ncbi:MAG: hypothetical protein KA371_21915 [Acidobacteria bacterium]|nr:hypothetical protein [Acidobacteriota bacterium]